MGAKPKKPKAPTPIAPPVKPEDEEVQGAGQNMIRRLYKRRDRNSQQMSRTTGGM